MSRTPFALTALIAVGLALTGCAGTAYPDLGANEPATPAHDTETPAGDSAPSPADVRGLVTVDGVSYEISELRNCEPLSDGTVERELELQGIGKHEGSRVQIDVYVQKLLGNPFDEVSWAGPEGVFGGPEDAAITLNDSGTRVSGSATLVDAATQSETIAVEFDLEVPAETIACR